uniref:Uncharacterized protein n=1 Tax=Moniliophthora roreri TaxID=221103 RepID=A0A0W0FHY7_MONRR
MLKEHLLCIAIHHPTKAPTQPFH